MKKKQTSEEIQGMQSVFEQHQLRDALNIFRRKPYSGLDKDYKNLLDKRNVNTP